MIEHDPTTETLQLIRVPSAPRKSGCDVGGRAAIHNYISLPLGVGADRKRIKMGPSKMCKGCCGFHLSVESCIYTVGDLLLPWGPESDPFSFFSFFSLFCFRQTHNHRKYCYTHQQIPGLGNPGLAIPPPGRAHRGAHGHTHVHTVVHKHGPVRQHDCGHADLHVCVHSRALTVPNTQRPSSWLSVSDKDVLLGQFKAKVPPGHVHDYSPWTDGFFPGQVPRRGLTKLSVRHLPQPLTGASGSVPARAFSVRDPRPLHRTRFWASSAPCKSDVLWHKACLCGSGLCSKTSPRSRDGNTRSSSKDEPCP